MPCQIDLVVANRLVTTALRNLWESNDEKITWTRPALKQALLAVAQDAYGIGFLAGQEMRLRESTAPGSTDRPAWMDIRIDDRAAMATQGLWLRPIVVRSLLGAGYRCLGDLRWVPLLHLIGLFYIGRKTGKQIRATVERLEGTG